MVSEFGKTHPHKPVENNVVRRQPAFNSRPVVLHVVPQQMPGFGVGSQRNSTVVDILDSHLIGEHKVQVILDNTSIFSAAKSRETNLLAINRVCPEVFFLDGVVFVTASLGNRDAKDCSTQVGVNSVSVFTCRPEFKATLSLGNDAIGLLLVKGLLIRGRGYALAFHCLRFQTLKSEVSGAVQ